MRTATRRKQVHPVYAEARHMRKKELKRVFALPIFPKNRNEEEGMGEVETNFESEQRYSLGVFKAFCG